MVLKVIEKYYSPNSPIWTILVEHSKCVRDKALEIISKHPELNVDAHFVSEAAMLHDIGIFLTHAPDLHCHGTKPYICHGYLGRQILENEDLPLHALVCERHTGTGLSMDEIINNNLPIPKRDMRPISIEEQLICFADKFYSKSGNLSKAKSIDKIRKSMLKHGQVQLERFNFWCELFL